jgi:thiol-disulfide isomerase/thioredoxin
MIRKSLCLWACFFVAVPSSAGPASDAVPVGGKLRAASLIGLNGPVRQLSSFHGRPLLINVWASWCGPCREEMASLERLAWRRDRQLFAIIGISTDDYADQAKGLLRDTHATISQFIDTGLQMEHMLGASRLPLTVLVSADGRVLLKVYGAREWDSPDALRLIDTTFHNGAEGIVKSGSIRP